LVNSSRGIIFNYEKLESTVKVGAREAVLEMNQAINDALSSADKEYWV